MFNKKNKQQDALREAEKEAAALAALDYLPANAIVGIGTGSTVNYLIDALKSYAHRIEGVVVTSQQTQQRLQGSRIPILELNQVSKIPIYIDGADEINPYLQMIKGGGGAQTREKIVATAADQFICIADSAKYVKALGVFPLAIEVLPLARSFVARQLLQLGGDPVYREGFVTDNGNHILDVYNLKMHEPIALEQQLNQIPGVIEHGLFAKRAANVLLLGTQAGVQTHRGSLE